MKHKPPQTAYDFRTLPKDGIRFESLVCDLLRAMNYRIVERPAIGTEGGRDVLIERLLRDHMTETSERVVVQCKHRAHSGRAVGDVGNWMQTMLRYQAQGYLLVTDTRVTENLSAVFRAMHEGGKWAAFWDADDLVRFLSEYEDVRDAYFPGVTLPRIGLFKQFVFCDFRGYDITLEKPRVSDERFGIPSYSDIGQKGSLFCWVKNNWPIEGLGRQNGDSWLLCDDGPGELADFVHIDIGAPTISLIHVKASRRKGKRPIAVSPFEHVVAKALQEARFVRRDALLPQLEHRVHQGVTRPVWHEGRAARIEDMVDALRGRSDTFDERIVVVQPHLQRSAYEEVGLMDEDHAAGGGLASHAPGARLARLNQLLESARFVCNSLGAGFVVVADDS